MYILLILLSLVSAPVLASANIVNFNDYLGEAQSLRYDKSPVKRSKKEFYGEVVEYVIDYGMKDLEHKPIIKKMIHDEDGHFYQVSENARINSPRERKSILVNVTAGEALGTQRTLIIPVGDPDVSGSSLIYTADFLNAIYFSNDATSLNTYYREVSSDRTSFAGNITGVLSISGLCSGGNIFQNGAAEFLMNLVDSQVDLSAYDRVSFVLPEDDHCMGSALGTAFIRNFAYINALNKPVRISFNWNVSAGASAGNSNYFIKVIAHEFGHNFGLKHDNGNSCGEKAFETAECESFEYGGVHSIMGYSPNLAHVNAIQQYDLKWLTNNQVKIINNTSFSGEFTISPLAADDDSSLKAIKIRRNDGSYYVVEYHRPIGMEAKYFVADPLNYDGVQIYLNNDSFSRDSILFRKDFAEVDVNDGFQVFDLRDQSSFGTSDEFYDPISDISITPLSINSESASFRIEKNPQEGGGTTSSIDPYLYTDFDSLALNPSGVTKTEVGIVFDGDTLNSETLLVIKIPKAFTKLIKISKKNRQALFVNNVADLKVTLAPLKQFTKNLVANVSGQFVITLITQVKDKATKEVLLNQIVSITLDSGN